MADDLVDRGHVANSSTLVMFLFYVLCVQVCVLYVGTRGIVLTKSPSLLRYLYGFEEYCRSASIQFRTIHHNNPRPLAPPDQKAPVVEPKEGPPPLVKIEPAEEKPGAEEEAESDSDSDKEEHKDTLSSPRVRGQTGFLQGASTT